MRPGTEWQPFPSPRRAVPSRAGCPARVSLSVQATVQAQARAAQVGRGTGV